MSEETPMELLSTPFGAFDPFNPSNISGPLAKIIFIEPIEIDAPIEKVWKSMVGFDVYPEWNPLNRFFKLDNEASVGGGVTFGTTWGPYDLSDEAVFSEHDIVSRETITVWRQPYCLAYADVRKHLVAERVQFLSELPCGRTRYHTYERTSGLMSPILRLGYTKKIQRGFTANGLALKKRVENM